MLQNETKLRTLSLILNSLPDNQKSLLMTHFSPNIQNKLLSLQAAEGINIAQMDWTPIYQSWPELKVILDDCKNEIKIQKLIDMAGLQRPSIKQYILMKLGKHRGAPVFLSDSVKKTVDKYMNSFQGA